MATLITSSIDINERTTGFKQALNLIHNAGLSPEDLPIVHKIYEDLLFLFLYDLQKRKQPFYEYVKSLKIDREIKDKLINSVAQL